MKKCIKLFSALILCSFLLFGFTSCLDDDDYTLDKYWRAIATLNKVGDNTYDFTLDDGTKLWVAAPVGLNLNPQYKRALINYTLLTGKQNEYDHFIRLNGLRSILTKNPIYIPQDNVAKQDSIGNDQVKVTSIWASGGYLNISFEYMASGEQAHMLNLVSDKEDLSVNDDVAKLEFRHNRNDDPANYPAVGYVCFDLAAYLIDGRESVTFEISTKSYSEEIKTYKVEYKYGEPSAEPEGAITSSENETTNLNIY